VAEDAEIKAMRMALEALEGLDADASSRVIAWVAQRRGVVAAARRRPFEGPAAQAGEAAIQFDSFAALFSAASLETEAQMALVGGYWIQVVQGKNDFSSQQVNDELKNLGHAVKNVTRAFDVLREKKPALVLQVQKAGRAKQGRKRLRLTQAGIGEVQQLIRTEKVD